MDNLAHTLAGAALGKAGLKNRSGLGLATLMIAANLPDIDALAVLVGESLTWRRGWTHGPIGLLLLPALLVAAMVGFDRWQDRRGTRPDTRLPVRAGWLLVLAYLGALSHPALDFLNTYGVRLMMPFSERWFYGDTLFIIDVWLWSMLALGVWLSRRRSKKGLSGPAVPAAVSLVAALFYVSVMGAATWRAERMTAAAVAVRDGRVPNEVVANPVAVNPLVRRMVFRVDQSFGFGEVSWTPWPHVRLTEDRIFANMNEPAIAAAAAQHEEVSDLLYWARLPYAVVERRPGETIVTIADARYRGGAGAGQFTRRVRLRTPHDYLGSGQPARR